MQVVHIFDAYHKTVRSLVMIHYSGMQSKPFDRMLSRFDSDKSSASSFQSSSRASSSDSVKSLYTHSAKMLQSSDSFSNEDGSTNSVLVSFGVGYKGVVRDCYEHPESFILPSEGHRTSHQQARMSRALGCLLLWSTEVCSSNKPVVLDKTSPNMQEFPELEEMVLPDDIASSYQ